MMKTLPFAFVLLWLVACVSDNTAPSIAESIARGYITIETLADATLAASESGYIDARQRATAREYLQSAKSGLDLAAQIADTGNTVEALTYVNMAYDLFATVRALIGEDGDGSLGGN
jgi:hypothetical protein